MPHRASIRRSLSRRRFLAAGSAAVLGTTAIRWAPRSDSGPALHADEPGTARPTRARIAITFDLEMSRHYPKRGMTEWDYRKGDLDEPTKRYALQAAQIAHKRGAVIHFFLVGRVLEQPDVSWLKEIAAMGHPIGNHTYDHVYVLATRPDEVQFRFRRAPWLIRGKSPAEVIHENIAMTTDAMKTRLGIEPVGFRTPGGFYDGLRSRPDVRAMLLDLGFRWVSSLYPPHESGQPGRPPGEAVYRSIVEAQKKAQPFVYPDGLIEIPMSPISDVGAFRAKRWQRPHFLEAVRRAVQWAIAHGGVFDFLCHPSCMVVEDPGFETLRMICDLVERAEDRAQVVSLQQIADEVRPAG